MRPQVTVSKSGNSQQFIQNVMNATRVAAFVGIPEASSRQRQSILRQMASGAKGKKRGRLMQLAAERVTNAQLLFIHSKGSPMRNIPARPVLEPAIASPSGKASINPELTSAARAMLTGDKREAIRYLNRAAMAGRNAARRWFDSGNLAPNAPSTIRRKGSDHPLIDTGAMKAAITGLVKED